MRHTWVAAALAGIGQTQRLTEHTDSFPDTLHEIPDDISNQNSSLFGVARITHKEQLSKKAIALTGGPGLGDCQPFPEGTAPLPSNNNWESFVNYADYSKFAIAAKTPAAYVNSFQDYNTSIILSPSYLGVHRISAYDPDLCANYCNDWPSCRAFNIYIARDPSKDPGPGCANPPAVANFKCTLFSNPVNAELAVNPGQILPPADVNGQEFAVKVRASNGYNKIRTSASATHQSPINGYDGPFSLPAAVNADNTVSNPGELIGTQNFKKSYDPSVCARLCDGINQSRKLEIEQQCASRLDAKQCAWKPCNYFNSYALVNSEGEQDGFYCALFTKPMSREDATVTSAKDGAGNLYLVDSSLGYFLSPQESGVINGPAYNKVDDQPSPVMKVIEPESTSDYATATITTTATTTKTIHGGRTRTKTVTTTVTVASTGDWDGWHGYDHRRTASAGLIIPTVPVLSASSEEPTSVPALKRAELHRDKAIKPIARLAMLESAIKSHEERIVALEEERLEKGKDVGKALDYLDEVSEEIKKKINGLDITVRTLLAKERKDSADAQDAFSMLGYRDAQGHFQPYYTPSSASTSTPSVDSSSSTTEGVPSSTSRRFLLAEDVQQDFGNEVQTDNLVRKTKHFNA